MTTRILERNRNLVPVFDLGTGIVVAIGATSAPSAALSRRARLVRLACTSACHVLIGAAPVATATHALVQPNYDRDFRVNIAQRPLAFIVDPTTDVFRFFEVEGAPFNSSSGNFRGALVTPVDGQTIYFQPEPRGVLPAPLAVDTPYYYTAATGKVSASITGLTPGAAVDITTAGSLTLAYFADRVANIQDAAAGNLSITEVG